VVAAADSNPEVHSAAIAAHPATMVLVLPTAEVVAVTSDEVTMVAQAHQIATALAECQWVLLWVVLVVVVGMTLVEAAHMMTDPEATVAAVEVTIPVALAVAVTWNR